MTITMLDKNNSKNKEIITGVKRMDLMLTGTIRITVGGGKTESTIRNFNSDYWEITEVSE